MLIFDFGLCEDTLGLLMSTYRSTSDGSPPGSESPDADMAEA